MTTEEIVIGFTEENIDDLISSCNSIEEDLRKRQIRIGELRNRIHSIRMEKKEPK